MATSSCPYCGAELPDPAGCFCPSCGGRLPETTGQDQPLVPAAGFCRSTPFLVFTSGLVLVIVVAAILVQVFILHAVPAPAAETAGTFSPSVGPEVSTTTGVLMTSGIISRDLHKIGHTTVVSAPVSTTLSTPAPSGTASAGPETGITGSLSYARQTRTTGSFSEVPVINASSLEARVHVLINRVREEHGLLALGMDAALTSLARAHSRDMAENGYFGHMNLDERDATARGAAAGYACHKDADPYFTYAITENLFATERYREVLVRNGRVIEYGWVSEETIAEETVDAWMNSPDHRDNILDPGMGREGIGVAIAAYDLVFVTEDFC